MSLVIGAQLPSMENSGQFTKKNKLTIRKKVYLDKIERDWYKKCAHENLCTYKGQVIYVDIGFLARPCSENSHKVTMPWGENNVVDCKKHNSYYWVQRETFPKDFP